MNLQTWAKWVAEIDAMTGGAIVELRLGRMAELRSACAG